MTKVTLRMKTISGGRKSLYLDFYPPIPHPETGKSTRREFLKIFVYDKPKTDAEKDHNKGIKDLANKIAAKRLLEIAANNYGFLSTSKQKADFVLYFSELAEKKEGSNSGNWLSALNYLKSFTGGFLSFANLNEEFCNDFREHLLTSPSNRSQKQNLSQNSAHSYFNKFKATLKQAFKDGYLQTDLNAKIEPIKQEDTERNYLTLEELQLLIKTECHIPVLKKAAIFSAYTGLRFSDIQKLIWAEVRKDGEDYSLHFMQKKTKGYEVLPISEQAYKILGERKGQNDLVFEGLEYSAYTNDKIRQWVLKAGISKEITFHNFRHTNATLLLSSGVDIYTVSKMLGHKNLKTTQIYAKVVDQAKKEAANKINLE